MNELRDSFPARPPHILRVWQPDEGEPEVSKAPRDEPRPLSCQSTLTEIFRDWYVPHVLVPSGTKDKSIGECLVALNWWSRFTGDPPVGAINDRLMADFKVALRSATYRRGKLGRDRQLAVRTQNKQIDYINALLERCGPTVKPRRRCLGLLAEVPYASPNKTEAHLKASIPLARVRQMMVCTADMTWPNIPGIPADLWWQAAGCLFFYTGQRRATLLNDRLVWEKVIEGDAGLAIHFDKYDIPKTGKAQVVPVHAELLTALTRIRTDDPRLLPCPFGESCFDDHFAVLQKLAGIKPRRKLCLACLTERNQGLPADKREEYIADGLPYRCTECGHERMFSPHALRRTHGTQLARSTKRDEVMNEVRKSLNHSDERVTMESYATDSHFVHDLPWILPPPIAARADANQMRLF